MRHIKMPSSYAALSEDEQRVVGGGGELSDALSTLFDNTHIDDFFFGNGVVSFSFTFVPFMLLNVVKVGYSAAKGVINSFTHLMYSVGNGLRNVGSSYTSGASQTEQV